MNKSFILFVGVAFAISASSAPVEAKKLFGKAVVAGLKLKTAQEKRKTLELEREEERAQQAAQAQIGSAKSASTAVAAEDPTDESRAKKVLAEENRGVGKLHPLQTNEPGYNIVVCEAGCGDAKPHIIYRIPMTAVRSASAESATPSSPVTNAIECRGGCDGPSNPSSLTGAKSGLLNTSAGSWLTTVDPSAPKAAAVPTATPAVPGVKPQASKANREDWMARINRERAADPKPAAEPESNSPSEAIIMEPGPIKEGNPISE